MTRSPGPSATLAGDGDPILLEVVRHAFESIADQMALIILRTSHSSIVRDSMDFSTALCDPAGRTLAQGLTNPGHLGSFYDAMRFLIERHAGQIEPGDVFVGNDPYAAAGMHLPDIYVIKPIFARDRLIGWATTLAHQVDVGGIVPGSNALGSREIFQEGLRLPFVKLLDGGARHEAVWEIIGLNVRLPDQLFGDLEAQIAGCRAGERGLLQLIEHYDLATVETQGARLQDYAERLTRAELRAIPDGTYRFVDHLDGLGETPRPIEIRVALTIAGDRAIVDWSGTAAQVEGGINASLPFTKAATYAALRAVMTVDVPSCQGFERCVEVITEPGSLVDPLPPAACGARAITGYRCIDALFGALAQVVPERVTADSTGGSTLPTLAGWHEGRPFIYSETFMGVWGAATTHDGQDGVPHMGANQSNTPVEFIEATYPLRVEAYGLVPDTGGPGRFRGGNAIAREFRTLADQTLLSVRSDKRAFPPHGLGGGQPGAPSWNIVLHDGGERILPVMVTEPVTLRRGDRFRHVMAGGGGHGDPLERDPDAVLLDHLEERVSLGHAREAYGVVIVPDDRPRIDANATRACRRARRSS